MYTSCGYLATKIYCFGGRLQSNVYPDTNMVMLDILNYSGSTAEEFKNRWVTVTTNPNGLEISQRGGIATVPLPDGKTMLLLGGWSGGNTKLPSQMLAFNGETRSWQKYPDYTEDPYGVRQIYYSAASYVPEYGIALYGGFETNYDKNYVLPGVNVTAYQDDSQNIRSFGFTSLTFLNIMTSSNPWSVYPTQTNKPNILSKEQTSIFDPRSNRIFYYGGFYISPPSIEADYFNFNNSLTFNLTDGVWGTQILQGSIPTKRMGHSTTLIGPTQRDVLLYGGQRYTDVTPSLDYCYTLNLDTYQWTSQLIEAKSSPILIRSTHSAVSVNKETVFILFGMDSNKNTILSLLMLNVSNPSKVTWLEKYTDANAAVVVSPDSNTTLVDEVQPVKVAKLSTGATAGIAVGATAGVIGIGIMLFCLIKKRKTERKRHEIEKTEGQQVKEQLPEDVIEVDWDEIDKNYAELPQFLDGATTVVDSVSRNRNTVLTRESVELQRPHSIGNGNQLRGSGARLSQKPDVFAEPS
ncbi:hypothetical protein INT47_012650 [Mucor saturninus]|uniref:Kelch repeat protein n=1 Tax=Mucor saturninus TaxID=64648 RepID=A0A8H7UZL5_9FUNG|nr:hypothetical protein INT47_012650 [Mucor saturninus]